MANPIPRTHSTMQLGNTVSLVAGSDMQEHQYEAVSITADGTFDLNTGTAIGILQDPVKLDEAGRIAISGISFYKATGVIAAGSTIAGVGIAVTSATAAEDVIAVLINPNA